MKTVVFFDILGFKSMIEKYSLEELSEKYERLIDKTNGLLFPLKLEVKVPKLFPDHPENKPWCYKQIFSDSIILISETDTGESCLKLLIYSWRLVQACVVSNMPVRGGIAFGDLYMNLRKNIVLGEGLTRAYELEKRQNWIGVAIDNSVGNKFQKLFKMFKDPTSIFSPLFFQYDVPFKDGTSERLHTLNWRLNLIVEKGTRSLFPRQNDEKVMEKIANTLEYAKSVVESGKVYDYSEELPVELRAFFHGSRKKMNYD